MNTPGSYKCTCASGYHGSGRQCVATKCQSGMKMYVGTEVESCDAKGCKMKCSEGYKKSDGNYQQTCDWRGKWVSADALRCEGNT